MSKSNILAYFAAKKVYNIGLRSYASPIRSSPPPQSSVATIKQVCKVSGGGSLVKNGNKTPSPPTNCRQSTFHPNNDVTLRRTNGVASNTPSSTSSSRRNAMYLQSTNVKTANSNQGYYQQHQQQATKPQQQPQQQQQQHQTVSNDNNWGYSSKSNDVNVRSSVAAVPVSHRSLSPQDIIINYEDPPSRSSPAPQGTNGGSAKNSKPPLPPALADGMCPAASSGGPRPPPRTRPKSWTSSLFNAMRNNHSSVTFQCVVEEQAGTGSATNVAVSGDKTDQHRHKDASELAMPLTAASASDGQKFYSLPRPGNDSGQNKAASAKTRSRTPSPFRTIIKGLVKGELPNQYVIRS